MDVKFRVTDKIVADSLGAVDLYTSPKGRYKPVVNGGIAVQLYTYPHMPDSIRPTHDMDLLVVPKLNSDGFRSDFGKGIAASLQAYNPEIDILRHVYEVRIKDNEIPFFLHSYKWSEKGWERCKRDVERQVSNAEKLSVPGSGMKVYTVRPEDIINGKLGRIRKLEEKCKLQKDCNENYIRLKSYDWHGLGSQDFSGWLSDLKQKKVLLPAMYDRGEYAFRGALDEYICSKDFFDISLISRLVSDKRIGFDEGYYGRISEGKE